MVDLLNLRVGKSEDSARRSPRRGRTWGPAATARRIVRGALVGGLVLAGAWAQAVLAQNKSYTWSDIDCRQSRIVPWPGMKCRTTNVVTTEGNVGAYRRWAAFGTTADGYIQIFLMEAQNSFSSVTAEDTTADFLKWMYENGQSSSSFSSVGRYHNADFLTFKDNKQGVVCAGFRRMGGPQRGAYQSVMGGIMCPPTGRNLGENDIGRFIDRVRVQ